MSPVRGMELKDDLQAFAFPLSPLAPGCVGQCRSPAQQIVSRQGSQGLLTILTRVVFPEGALDRLQADAAFAAYFPGEG